MSDQNKKMYLDDSVLARFVQIFQEAMLTGTDATDHFRMIQLEFSENKGKLVLTPEYVELVKSQHSSMLKFIEEVQSNGEQPQQQEEKTKKE